MYGREGSIRDYRSDITGRLDIQGGDIIDAWVGELIYRVIFVGEYPKLFLNGSSCGHVTTSRSLL